MGNKKLSRRPSFTPNPPVARNMKGRLGVPDPDDSPTSRGQGWGDDGRTDDYRGRSTGQHRPTTTLIPVVVVDGGYTWWTRWVLPEGERGWSQVIWVPGVRMEVFTSTQEVRVTDCRGGLRYRRHSLLIEGVQRGSTRDVGGKSEPHNGTEGCRCLNPGREE